MHKTLKYLLENTEIKVLSEKESGLNDILKRSVPEIGLIQLYPVNQAQMLLAIQDNCSHHLQSEQAKWLVL